MTKHKIQQTKVADKENNKVLCDMWSVNEEIFSMTNKGSEYQLNSNAKDRDNSLWAE